MTDETARVAVEQCDRIAAAPIVAWAMAPSADEVEAYRALCRAGDYDDHFIVQAFAKERHRLAALSTLAQPAGEDWPFQAGQRVEKIKGLPFGAGDAVVRCCYQMANGAWRVVAEHPEGWQHIFEPSQLTLSS